MSIKFHKLETEKGFESLKKGDEVIVVWKERECWNNSMKGNMLYRVIDNYRKQHEIILRIKGNHYFNYKMLLKGESIAKEVYLIMETKDSK